jgi:hypothetical protein
MRRAAGGVAIGAGLGFGIPDVVGIGHFVRTGEVRIFLGFPTYGDGPFERIGLETSVLLLGGYLVVCAADVVLGVLILKRRSYAGAASYALLPVELAFWVGFALPFGLVLGLTRVALMAKISRRAASDKQLLSPVPQSRDSAG